MISYKLQIPTSIVNGRPAYNCIASPHRTLEEVKDKLSRHKREYAKFAKVWRLTEEEIDIDKEDW